MSKVSISQAAKLAKISRSTLYNKYINTGKITVESIEDKKMIDVSELIRVFGSSIMIDSPDDIDNTAQDIVEHGNNTTKDTIIRLLEKQLEEARDREKWLIQQLEKTTHLLENKQDQPKRKKFLGMF